MIRTFRDETEYVGVQWTGLNYDEVLEFLSGCRPGTEVNLTIVATRTSFPGSFKPTTPHSHLYVNVAGERHGWNVEPEGWLIRDTEGKIVGGYPRRLPPRFTAVDPEPIGDASP